MPLISPLMPVPQFTIQSCYIFVTVCVSLCATLSPCFVDECYASVEAIWPFWRADDINHSKVCVRVCVYLCVLMCLCQRRLTHIVLVQGDSIGMPERGNKWRAHASRASCGLWGCENWPSPFPGRLS